MNCLLCGTQIEIDFNLRELVLPMKIKKRSICHQCDQEFERLGGIRCDGCGRSQKSIDLCEDCQKWEHQVGFVINNRSAFEYNDAMHEYMKQYKFTGDYRLRSVFTTEFEKLISKQQPDVIVPIPINKSTWQTRGFNQVTGITSNLRLIEALETIDDSKETRQSKKNRAERMNSKQPFKLSGDVEITKKISHQRVLIVDDVYTTGRTIYHAANLLLTLSPMSISSVTLAR